MLFQDDSLNRCSISAESQTDTSGSEDSSVDEHPDIKINGYQDAENEVHLEADYGRGRRHSVKLSQSSGSSSDLYDYKVLLLSLSSSPSPSPSPPLCLFLHSRMLFYPRHS